MPEPPDEVEVAVIGGGPAGLSASLMLGRCQRRTIVLDAGGYRNERSGAVHGYLGRDGTPPAELRAIAQAEVARYPTVERRAGHVVAVEREGDGGFLLQLEQGRGVRARAVLIATGLVDVPPPIPGAAELIGDGVYPCPYCDGWETRGGRYAIYAHGDERGERFARVLGQWAGERVFHPAGGAVEADVADRLRASDVAVDLRPIARVAREGGRIVLVREGGDAAVYDALFFSLGARQRSDLAARLGCSIGEDDGVAVSSRGETCIPGVYVAGDASRDVLQAVVAAGEGTAAAILINGYLARSG